jgi:hypothetical protein
MTFREAVLKWHPDYNGGDTSRVCDFTRLMNHRRVTRLCACGCGEKLSAVRVRKGCRFASRLCATQFRFYRGQIPHAVRHAVSKTSL